MKMAYCISYARGHHRTNRYKCMICFRRVDQQLFIGVCPLILYRRVIHKVNYQSMTTNLISEGCPQIKQIFLFLKLFFIHGKCMFEGVSEDSRHGTGHVDIQVGVCIILLECVCGCHCMST